MRYDLDKNVFIDGDKVYNNMLDMPLDRFNTIASTRILKQRIRRQMNDMEMIDIIKLATILGLPIVADLNPNSKRRY